MDSPWPDSKPLCRHRLPPWPLYIPHSNTEKAGGTLRSKACMLSHLEETWGRSAGWWAGEVRAALCRNSGRLAQPSPVEAWLSVQAWSWWSEWQEWSAGGLGWAVSWDTAEVGLCWTWPGRSWRLRAQACSQTCLRSQGEDSGGSLESEMRSPMALTPPMRRVQGGGRQWVMPLPRDPSPGLSSRTASCLAP